MKLFRHLATLVCIGASFIANAAEQLAGNAQCTAHQPTAVELQPLQGTWEGLLVGDKLQKKVTLTITGNSLHFHRDRNFWFEATIAVPAGADPKQLHATIKNRAPSQPVSVGRVVRAFFKIEDGTLILATIGDEGEETPKSFEAAGTRYELRKVQGDGILNLAAIGDDAAAETRTDPRKAQTRRTYTQPPKAETDNFRFEVGPKQAEKSEK